MQTGAPPLSFHTACLVLILFGVLGIASFYDVFDGPGSPRQERIAKTPDLPATLGDVPRFVANARFHMVERYALKDFFIETNAAAKLAIFGKTATPSVMQGKDGFLFLTTDGVIPLIQGQNALLAGEAAAWDQHFNTLAQAFAARNIPFLFVLAPNKHSVYSEALPTWVIPAPVAMQRSTQVLAQAGKDLVPQPVDLKAVLQEVRVADPSIQLYHKTDTHWNALGATIALQRVLKTAGIPTPTFDVSRQVVPQGGDLARMMGRQFQMAETLPDMHLPGQTTCHDPDGTRVDIITLDPLLPRRFGCHTPQAQDLKLVAFIDSFGVSAVPFLAATFRNAEFIWQDAVDPALAAELGADVALQILVERKIHSVSPASLRNLNDAP